MHHVPIGVLASGAGVAVIVFLLIVRVISERSHAARPGQLHAGAMSPQMTDFPEQVRGPWRSWAPTTDHYLGPWPLPHEAFQWVFVPIGLYDRLLSSLEQAGFGGYTVGNLATISYGGEVVGHFAPYIMIGIGEADTPNEEGILMQGRKDAPRAGLQLLAKTMQHFFASAGL